MRTTTIKMMILTMLAAAVSCCRMHEPQAAPGEMRPLQLSVSAQTATKAPVTGSYLPSGSEIGLFLVTEEGQAYGNTNVRYTASGESSSQTWTSTSPALLGQENVEVKAYYPYSAGTADPARIPVEISSQTDYMWGRYRWVSFALWQADISLSHALCRTDIKISRGSYTGEMDITSLTIAGEGLATAAEMDCSDGTLTGITGQGSTIDIGALVGGDLRQTTVMAVPTGEHATTTITAVIDGQTYTVQKDMTYSQGMTYTYNLTFDGTALGVINVYVDEWDTADAGAGESGGVPYTLTLTGDLDNIIHKEYWHDGQWKITAAASNGAVKAVSLSEGSASLSQSTDASGTRTITLSNVKSDVTVRFNGTEFMQWARIQHVNGILYTADQWIAAEQAGEVTDADANGVAVRYSRYAACPHVIYPKYATEMMKWSSNNTVTVPGVYTTTTSDSKSDPSSSIYDMDGKANTDALLAAVTAGTIPDAPAAQYCDGVTFAGGQKGYLPAAGEISVWGDNKTAINACMDAIGGDRIGESTFSFTWTSTQYSGGNAWVWDYLDTNRNRNKCDISNVRAVSAFTYDLSNEYSNR